MEVIYVSNDRTVDYYFNSLYRRRYFNPHKSLDPSVFVCAVLFLIGYWTFFPADIISRAGIGTPVAIMLMYLLITNMGTLLSLKELAQQWKTVVISLAGIAGIAAAVFAVSLALFDRNTALVTIPPLVGGIVSSLIMSQGASNAGLVDLSVFAILIYVMQGFAGYPLTAIMLQREGKTLLARYRSGEHHPITSPMSTRCSPSARRKCRACSVKSPLATTATTLNSCAWRWSAVWPGLSPTSRNRS
jgi:hypothetical protein